MICIKLIGGLGNQMFQYALGRSLALKNNCPFLLDKHSFAKYKLHRYSLDNFNIQENFIEKRKVPKDRFYYRLPFFKKQFHHFEQQGIGYNEMVMALKPSLYLEGYWQSEKYFFDIRDILLKDFSVKIVPDGDNFRIKQMIEQKNSVSLHVRRGDYVSDSTTNEKHGTCSLEYYKKAIEEVGSKVPNPHFFVFSDDQAWVKNNLKVNKQVTYVDHNDALTNYEDLRLMSCCQHNIIANSSFSWWGAWLNVNPSKIVIAPSRWYNGSSEDTSDVVPTSWLTI